MNLTGLQPHEWWQREMNTMQLKKTQRDRTQEGLQSKTSTVLQHFSVCLCFLYLQHRALSATCTKTCLKLETSVCLVIG